MVICVQKKTKCWKDSFTYFIQYLLAFKKVGNFYSSFSASIQYMFTRRESIYLPKIDWAMETDRNMFLTLNRKAHVGWHWIDREIERRNLSDTDWIMSRKAHLDCHWLDNEYKFTSGSFLVVAHRWHKRLTPSGQLAQRSFVIWWHRLGME